MPLPVATGCYLVRFIWGSGDEPRPASHGLYFQDASGTQTAADLGTSLLANVTANMWKLVSPSTGVSAVFVTPLDGTSVTYSVPIPVGFAAWSGQGTGQTIPQGCMVVTVRSDRRGPAFRNRSYVPFIGEGDQNSGLLDPTAIGTAQTAWTTFFSAMAGDAWDPVVITPSDANPSTNNRLATTYDCRPFMKTQRRRARR